MKRILVDCGAWKGTSIAALRQLFDPNGDAEVHTFEPHPLFAPSLQAIPGHTFHGEAVWIHDGTVKFYLQEEDPVWNQNGEGQGHSLMVTKTNVTADHYLEVPSIDFSRWVREALPEGAEIIIKLDIEGAEYAVLKKMIADGTLAKVHTLLVEFHHHKCPALIQAEEFSDLLSQITVPLLPWA